MATASVATTPSLETRAVALARQGYNSGLKTEAVLQPYITARLTVEFPGTPVATVASAASYAASVVIGGQVTIGPGDVFGSLSFDPAKGIGAVTGALGDVLSVGKFLNFLVSYRFLEVVAGGVLVLLGLYLLGSQIGVRAPAFPGSATTLRVAGRLNRATPGP